MKNTIKLTPFFALFLGFNAMAHEAFTSPAYEAHSQEPLNGDEMTVTYQYPANPCGTLMTQFTTRGSTHLGRGPVYHKMLKKCQAEDSNSYPDDHSVRTYACQNVASNGAVLGKATFAFQCGGAQSDEQLVKVPLNRIPAQIYKLY